MDPNLHLLSKETQASVLKNLYPNKINNEELLVFRKCHNCPHKVWQVKQNQTWHCGCQLYHSEFAGNKRDVCPCTFKKENIECRLEVEQFLLSDGHFSGHEGPLLGNKPGAIAVMQTDGNLVIYYRSQAIWASNTCGAGQGPFKLALTNEGNLVILDSTGNATWKAGHRRSISEHPCFLVFQDDGNLVLYDANSNPLWASDTDGRM
eukprot:NODE_497_length_6803_cov_1.267900.p4 type:complete len:206 gc:universal NODE_497_length_6803_cov_1.267900:3719-4336(+)